MILQFVFSLFWGDEKSVCEMEQACWGLETEIHSGIWWWLEQASGIPQGSPFWEILEWLVFDYCICFIARIDLKYVCSRSSNLTGFPTVLSCGARGQSTPRFELSQPKMYIDFEHWNIGSQYLCITTENAWNCMELFSGIFCDMRMDLWSSILLHKRSLFVAVATIALFRSVFGRTPYCYGTILTRSLSQPVLPQP